MVIAIIAIIAALLLPVLSQAKNTAAKATDFNNLHQITMAVHVYTGDNHDILPWPNWDYGSAMKDGTARPGWLYTLNLSESGTNAFNGQAGLLWDSLRGGKVLLCPMDQRGKLYPQPNGKVDHRPEQLSTYIMNGAVIGFRSGYYSNAIPVKISQMLPEDCVFFEADDRQAFSYNDGSSWPSEGVTARHSNGATLGAVDGSASYVRDDDWNEEVSDPNKNRLWCYPLTDDGGDPVYGHVLFNN